MFSRVGLRPGENALTGLGTLVHFEGLVLQLSAYPATRVAILDALVLVEHAHDAAVLIGGEMHEALHDVLGHDTIVDVVDQVAEAIENHQVGSSVAHGHFESRQALGNRLLADIENVELLGGKMILLDTGHLADALAEDVFGGLIALLGIVPEYMQAGWLDPFDGEHLAAKAQRHQYGADKRLSALGLA